MAKFQVVSVKPLSGTSGSGRAWSMMIYSGVFHNDDGSVEVGELSMMLRDGAPAPAVRAGESYTPVFVVRPKDGKLVSQLGDLKPLIAAAKAA